MEMTADTNTDTNPSFLHLLHEASYLNSEGISALFVSGRRGNELAIVAFRRSLRILEGLAAGSGHDLEDMEAIETSTLLTAERIPQLYDEAFHIYDQPKMFSPTAEDISSTARLTAFSAAVIFNMAIAYHRQAMLSKRSKCFHGAQRLYNGCALLCSNMLAENPDSQDILILYMACVNNKAHVQNWLLERSDLQSSLALLQQLVAKVAERAPGVETLSEVTLNVMMVRGQHAAAPVA